jgi:hypothetical protein
VDGDRVKALAVVITVIWVACMAVLGGCDDMSLRGRVQDVGFSENVEVAK